MAELEQLEAQILELHARANALRTEKRANVIAELVNKIADYNVSANELFSGRKVKSTKSGKHSSPATVKFRGPNGETWSGRGLTPRWLVAQISEGKTKESFAV